MSTELAGKNLFQIEREITDLNEKRRELGIELGEAQTTLSILNRRVGGSRLPQHEYRSICRQQAEKKREIDAIRREMSDIKTALSRLSSEKYRRRLELDLATQGGAGGSGDRESGALVSEITRLRDKYLAFSADQTRVSSMRLMASQIAEELTELVDAA